MTATDSALLLFAHGARDPAWARPFEAITAQLRAQAPQRRIELAFLELMSPDLPTAATALAEEGLREVTIVPLFLGAGGHVRRDLPPLMERLRAEHPEVTWHLTPSIGESPVVVAAIAAATLSLAGEAAGGGA
jgi:sirohydrochlorin cobaltochelatase